MLANLYNKVNVLHKKGPTNDPGNFRMISLTSSIAKTYHLLLAKRLTKLLTMNNYINEKVQKAFLPKIKGTIEHNVVLEEIRSQAKTNKKMVHVTFFDLEDAFGSVPHPLIIHTLKRFNVLQKLSFISTPCIITNYHVYLRTTSLLMGFPLKEEYFKVTRA